MTVPSEPTTPKPQEDPVHYPPDPERKEPDREEENGDEDDRPDERESLPRSEDDIVKLTKEAHARSPSAAATSDTSPPPFMTDGEIAWMVLIAQQVYEGKELHSGVQVLCVSLAKTVLALQMRVRTEETLRRAVQAEHGRARDVSRSTESS